MEAEVCGIKLFYNQTGNGAPLILLHGNGEDHHIFDPLAAKLAAHFTVYAVDSRNHGQSTKTDVFGYEAMAADVYALMKALGIRKADFIGFSDGAILALLLALAHPEAVNRLVLLGVNLKPSDFTERSRQYIQNVYNKTKDPLYRLMLEEPNIELDAVKNVHAKTLLVAAEREIYRPELYNELAGAMPNATLKMMPGHKHDTYVVGSDLLYPDLMAFFKLEQ